MMDQSLEDRILRPVKEEASTSPPGHALKPQRMTENGGLSFEAGQDMTRLKRPAVALLLHCAQRRLNNKADAEIKGLIEQIKDWDDLLKISFRHGLMPLLYWHLRAA